MRKILTVSIISFSIIQSCNAMQRTIVMKQRQNFSQFAQKKYFCTHNNNSEKKYRWMEHTATVGVGLACGVFSYGVVDYVTSKSNGK